MGKELWDKEELTPHEVKIRALERDLSEFIERIGRNPRWDRFMSMPHSIKEALIEEWFINEYKHFRNENLCEVLEKLQYYDVLGKYLERFYAGQYYSPGIVEAAEAYEKAGKLEDALRLYREGIEKCSPNRIEVYDENTGGYMSAMDFPEYNKKEIEEAVNLVRKCKEKVKEMKRRLRKRKKDKERVEQWERKQKRQRIKARDD